MKTTPKSPKADKTMTKNKQKNKGNAKKDEFNIILEESQKKVAKKKVDLKDNAQNYCICKYSADKIFTGPSKYFSQEALKAYNNNFLGERHLEMIYATLTSWGMHRMGKSGSKMPDYDVFVKSINNNKKELTDLSNKKIEGLPKNELKKLLLIIDNICFGDECHRLAGSTTGSRIVSASKILAHILPDLVPPIDREYTAKYLNIYINSLRDERILLCSTMLLLHDFYHKGNGKQDNEKIQWLKL